MQDEDVNDFSLLEFKFGGTYAITPALLAEGGYSYTKYGSKDSGLEINNILGGFFLGVKATF